MTEAPCVDATCSVDCSTSTGELLNAFTYPTGWVGSMVAGEGVRLVEGC
jgi:hypothetical protein